LVLLVVGCNDVAGSTTATLDMTILDTRQGQPLGEGPPLEGVELCQAETRNCDLSDSLGRVSIQVPMNEEISYTLEKEEYASYLLADVSGGELNTLYQVFNLPNARERARQYEPERLDSPYPMRFTGTIVVETIPPLAGVTFALVGATGKAFYVDEEDNWRLDLTATTCGGSSRGRGGFVEVTPGEYQVELGGTAEGCVRQTWGWPGDRDNSVRLPVQENHTSYVVMTCGVPPTCSTTQAPPTSGQRANAGAFPQP
jgi:hypothetical protein